MLEGCWVRTDWMTSDSIHDDVINWKYFPRYLPFVRGIHWSHVNSPHKGPKARDAELWCFLWSAPEQTAKPTVQMLVIWDAMAIILTSLQWMLMSRHSTASTVMLHGLGICFTLCGCVVYKRSLFQQNTWRCCLKKHDDVTKWKHFPRYWPFCGEFTGHRWIPHTKPVTRSFDVFIDLRLNKRLSKHSWGWWFETLSCPSWRHSNEKCSRCVISHILSSYLVN